MPPTNQKPQLAYNDFELIQPSLHDFNSQPSPSQRSLPQPTHDDEEQFQRLIAQLRLQDQYCASQPPMTNSKQSGIMFPSFLDTSSSSSTGGNPNGTHNANPPSVPRLAPSPFRDQPPQQQQQSQQSQANQQVNGNAMNGFGGPGTGPGLPMSAGQQMDVNMLYQRVLELGEVLRENRERTGGIIQGAEELSTRAARQGADPSVREADAEISAARIADLERQLAHSQARCATVVNEQKENNKLLGEYESAVGSMVEMVRNYSFSQKQSQNSLLVHYNKLLQEEKDAHLEARLEKDHWHTKFMQAVEMLREAYRLRCEEEDVPSKVAVGLQEEVRAYRKALGMEKEKPEEEVGWEILKDMPQYRDGEQE